ncbi:MAG: UPF0182 family protein [Dehalococcoidia bacterium]|nr:UPF0182 family protein [Dehalococcoidia bacterium]
MIIAILFSLFISFSVLKDFYSEWLWFSNLGYGSVYTTVLKN